MYTGRAGQPSRPGDWVEGPAALQDTASCGANTARAPRCHTGDTGRPNSSKPNRLLNHIVSAGPQPRVLGFNLGGAKGTITGSQRHSTNGPGHLSWGWEKCRSHGALRRPAAERALSPLSKHVLQNRPSDKTRLSRQDSPFHFAGACREKNALQRQAELSEVETPGSAGCRPSLSSKARIVSSFIHGCEPPVGI